MTDDMFWMATTIWMEAAGESYLGKLAVGHVIMNRARIKSEPVGVIVLANRQFSAWNHDSPTRRPLVYAMKQVTPSWKESLRAAESALKNLEPDPTNGATHYLNPELTRQINKGKLPAWYHPKKITVEIGRHVFLKLPY